MMWHMLKMHDITIKITTYEGDIYVYLVKHPHIFNITDGEGSWYMK